MRDLVEIYRMTELSVEVRCRLIVKVGQLVNYQYGANVTEPIVHELLALLDSSHPLLKEEVFCKLAKEKPR
jgi:hypothetical protein